MLLVKASIEPGLLDYVLRGVLVGYVGAGGLQHARRPRVDQHREHGLVPLDALVIELNTSRNAIYKTLFDARGELRAALAAKGCLEGDAPSCR